MKEHLPISLERTASIRARADRGERLDALLAAEGLTMDLFLRAQRGWLARIGDETKRRRHALGQRYQEAYLSERPDLLPAPRPKEESIDATGIGIVLDLGAVLPFTEGSPRPAEPPTPVEPPVVVQAQDETVPRHEPTAAKALRSSVDETSFLSPLSLDLGALPFDQKAPARPASPPQPSAPPARQASAPEAPAPLPNAAPPPPAPLPPAPAPAPPRSPSEADGTAFMAPIQIDEPLPFRGEALAPRSAAEDVASEAADLAGATAFVAALSDADLGIPQEPSLSLERYASLLVDLERTRDQPALLERYGLTPASFEAERSAWAPRLTDPTTAARLREAMHQYRTWLDRR